MSLIEGVLITGWSDYISFAVAGISAVGSLGRWNRYCWDMVRERWWWSD